MNPYTERLLETGPGRLRAMDAAGIDLQVLSLATPGVQDFEPEVAVSLARDANDRLAGLIQREPQRYAGLAVFSPQAPASAAIEIERAITRLGLNGTVVHSHTGGEYLDDPKCWEIFEATEALGVPLYLHPRSPSTRLGGPALDIDGFRVGWAFGVETATHALRLIAAGVFERFPGLKVILGHMGENLPFAMPRIDERYRIEQARGGAPLRRLPGEYFADNFLITTSGLNAWPQLRLTLETHGADKVLFATDYPFEDTAAAVESLRRMPLTGDGLQRLCAGNASRVFGLAQPAVSGSVPLPSRS